MSGGEEDSGPTPAELLEELANTCEGLTRENEMLTKLLASDSGQAGMLAAIKQLGREVESLRERNAALMEEKNAAIRAARTAQKKVIK